MSIQSEITRIQGNVSDALDAIYAKGVTIPSGANSDDLATLIAQIQTGAGSAIIITDVEDEHGGINREITAVSLAGDTVSPEVLLTGYTAHNALGQAIVGTASGGGSYTIPMGGIRPDAELVKTWTYDKRVVADEKVTIPAYSTNAVTLVASADIDTYTVDHTNYAYMVIERILTIPIYKSAYTGGAGKEEYVFSAINYELTYEPGNTYATLDGTKSYATANPAFATHGQFCRFLYWNSATNVAIYTSAAYGVGHTYTTPTIVANGTLTVKSPAFQIRGHATYLRQAVYEQVDDIRNQYVIELWRVPKDPNKVNGWDIYSSVDSIINDIKNNNCKLR